MLRSRVAKYFSENVLPDTAFIDFVARSIAEWKNFCQIYDFSWNICPPLVNATLPSFKAIKKFLKQGPAFICSTFGVFHVLFFVKMFIKQFFSLLFLG